MKEKMICVNSHEEYGETVCDAKVPISLLVPGLRLSLPPAREASGKAPRAACIVKQVHYSHNWIRVEFLMNGNNFSECMKFVVEGE